ncbi:MAG: hypothetical protein M1823_001080 [Watsoniomyces obsoletus]|nr:MAG: hypothetical protein M1823_001080 [Watsoniomyces obsoletus]
MDPGIAYDLAQIFCKDNEGKEDENILRTMTSADIHNRPFLPNLPTDVDITFERKNFKGECSTSCANIFRHLILSCQSDKHVVTGSADVPANCGTYSYSVFAAGSMRPSPKDCNTGSPFQSANCPYPNGRPRG